MGNLLEWGAKKLIFGVLSVVGALVWMSFTGSDGDYEELDRIPAVAFGGGAGELTVDVKVSEPAHMHASFSQYDESDDSEEAQFVQEDLAASHHLRSVDVGPDTYVYFEIGIDDPAVGASIEWTIYLDGDEVAFRMVYIREAHALDSRSPMGGRGMPILEDPVTLRERQQFQRFQYLRLRVTLHLQQQHVARTKFLTTQAPAQHAAGAGQADQCRAATNTTAEVSNVALSQR